ncbi:hypothetical protein D3C76_973040 [compost metagenome]|uniref:flagellar biosynthetic protein FliO n=1 Tax=Pseudomonas putida TaxID=303 RepID=UPI000FB10CB0|nr:flagellar biosynthetic protein FliO [Pseudomonas putida]WPK02524.1 flagellar biosynthetic protein FliO [Pseudomonas putida]
MTTVTDQVAAPPPLPLRYDDPISLMLIIKTLAITALLLAVAYVALRWYSRRGNVGIGARNEQAGLHCIANLRLSPRTRVFLVKTANEQVLITETPTGATVTRLSGPAPATLAD